MNYHAADLRRAGALIRWYGLNHQDGIQAIIEETAEKNRPTELLQSICLIYDALIDLLITPIGKVSIATELSLLARDPEDPDMRRAATWICASAARDANTLNDVLIDAVEPENRIGQLILDVVGIHARLVPCVQTFDGLKRMENITQRLLMRENGLDPDSPAA